MATSSTKAFRLILRCTVVAHSAVLFSVLDEMAFVAMDFEVERTVCTVELDSSSVPSIKQARDRTAAGLHSLAVNSDNERGFTVPVLALLYEQSETRCSVPPSRSNTEY